MSRLRIKYIDHKYKEGFKISLNDYVSESTGARYRIVLNLEDMEYYIRNERTKEYVFKSNSYGNLNVLKRNARNKLQKFGVNLGREVRNRTFGRCDKGFSQEKHIRLQREKNKQE